MGIDLTGEKRGREKSSNTYLRQLEAEAFKIIKQPYFLKVVKANLVTFHPSKVTNIFLFFPPHLIYKQINEAHFQS